MGGAVDVPGNVIVGDITADDGLEWNLAADPSAVSAVFGTATPISLVPLDATDGVPVPSDLAERLAEDHEAAGADLVYELPGASHPASPARDSNSGTSSRH